MGRRWEISGVTRQGFPFDTSTPAAPSAIPAQEVVDGVDYRHISTEPGTWTKKPVYAYVDRCRAGGRPRDRHHGGPARRVGRARSGPGKDHPAAQRRRLRPLRSSPPRRRVGAAARPARPHRHRVHRFHPRLRGHRPSAPGCRAPRREALRLPPAGGRRRRGQGRLRGAGGRPGTAPRRRDLHRPRAPRPSGQVLLAGGHNAIPTAATGCLRDGLAAQALRGDGDGQGRGRLQCAGPGGDSQRRPNWAAPRQGGRARPERLLDGPGLRLRVGTQARRWVSRERDWKVLAGTLSAIYEELAARWGNRTSTGSPASARQAR
jgi:hypothetical protein